MKYLLVLSVLVILVGFLVPSYAFDLHPQVQGNMTYQERQQMFLQISKPNELSGGNYFIMILKTPAGPELDNFVINATDLDKLRNNVGIFTVCGSIQNGLCMPPVFTQSHPTNNYCDLAIFIHFSEDGYDNKPVGNSTIFVATTPPTYCSIQHVPEFGQTVAIISAIAVMTAILITAKSGLMVRK